MLDDLPSDILMSVLSSFSLPQLTTFSAVSRRSRLLSRATAASAEWRQTAGHAAQLRRQMWRRGAAEHDVLGGGHSGTPHCHAPLSRCVALHAVRHASGGAMLASGDDSGVAVLWRLGEGSRTSGLVSWRHQRPLLCLALNQAALATGCDDGVVRVWPIGEVAETLRGREGAIGALPAQQAGAVQVAPSGVWVGALQWIGSTHLLSGGADRMLKLWNTAPMLARSGQPAGVERSKGQPRRPEHPQSGAPLVPDHAVRAHSKPVVAIAAAPGGAEACGAAACAGLVLSGSIDGGARAWDVTAGLRCVRKLEASCGAIRCISWERGAAAGHGLFSAACSSSDGVVRLWDLRLRRESIARISAGRGLADAITLADGALFTAGGADRTVAIWDLRQRKIMTRLASHVGAVTVLAPAIGGDGIVSADAAGSIRHWSLSRVYGQTA